MNRLDVSAWYVSPPITVWPESERVARLGVSLEIRADANLEA